MGSTNLLLIRADKDGVGKDQVTQRLFDDDHFLEPNHQLIDRPPPAVSTDRSLPSPTRQDVPSSSRRRRPGRRGGSTGSVATRRVCPECATATDPPFRTSSLTRSTRAVGSQGLTGTEKPAAERGGGGYIQ